MMELTINAETVDPDTLGEAYLSIFSKNERWGYYTHDFDEALGAVEMPVDAESDLLYATICAGCYAKDEIGRIGKWRINSLKVCVYLYWDGDGTIVIVHDDGEILENTDCKKSYGWEFVTPDHWAVRASADPSYFEDGGAAK